MDVKETDFVLQPKQDLAVMFDANTNLYNIDPFKKQDTADVRSLSLPKEDPDKVVNSFFGINVFNTNAVKERIASLTGFDGIAPRWTIFGNLMDP